MGAKRAMTLVEFLVAMVLGLLVFLIALTVFVKVRKTGYSASSAFVLGQDSALGFQTLRQDLADTSLQSIRVEANPTPNDNRAWLNMAAARDAEGQLLITPAGVPGWNQRVCYRLLPDADGDGISNLVRFTKPEEFPGHHPVWHGGMPIPLLSQPTMPAQPTVIFNQILAPGYKIGQSSPGIFAPVASADSPRGGFLVNFVRQDSVDHRNPNQESDSTREGWSKGSTGMLEVRLTMAERNASSGRYSLITLPIRVTPRH